jgi:hypothetical protein
VFLFQQKNLLVQVRISKQQQDWNVKRVGAATCVRMKKRTVEQVAWNKSSSLLKI